jgi:hypothetical protein
VKTLGAAAIGLLLSLSDAFGVAQECALKPATSAAAPAFVSAADVTRAFQGLSPRFTDDEPLRVIDVGSNRLGIFVVGRPKKTGPARVGRDGAVQVSEGLQLDQVTAFVQVLEGSGTFVAGGALVAPERMRRDDPDAEVIGPGRRGRAIRGGQSRRLSAGDMVIIPAGIPHGFSEIEVPLRYLVVRVDTGRTLPLK